MSQEIWKDIPDYEGFYQVSNKGRIKSLQYWNGHDFKKGEKILAVTAREVNKNPRYARSVVKLTKNGVKKDFKVHRIVAQVFLENPYNYQVVNHIDGNPLNNEVDNLEWCTQKHNMQQAFDNDNCCKTINSIDRETMVELLNNGFTYDDISQMLGIAKGTVFNYIKKFGIKKIYR